MCSIYGRRFTTAWFGVRGSRGWAHLTTRSWVPFLRGGREWAHLIAHPWVPISLIMTHMVYLLPLSWLQKRFHPFAPDTMINTALEATTSSSGKVVLSRNSRLLLHKCLLVSTQVWTSKLRFRGNSANQKPIHDLPMPVNISFVLSATILQGLQR